MHEANGAKARKRTGDEISSCVIQYYSGGFGAGPGCDWYIELTFLPVSDGFCVFRRSSGTIDEEWEEANPGTADVYDEDGNWEAEQSATRIASLNQPLTWRRALHFVRRLECVQAGYEDVSSLRVRGLAPWQRTVFRMALDRRARVPGLLRFYLRLADEDLKGLHQRLGGLRSKMAKDTVPVLAGAIRAARLNGRTLREIAEIASAPDPWDPESLAAAVDRYRLQRQE
jgi:hypothetical protein